jgi:hypothetical protein
MENEDSDMIIVLVLLACSSYRHLKKEKKKVTSAIFRFLDAEL